MASQKTLASLSRKELAQLAKHNNVEGWHSMRKASLVDALKNRRLRKPITERSQPLRAQERNTSHAPLRRSASKPRPQQNGSAKTSTHLPVRLQANAEKGRSEMLFATPHGTNWIYASWRLTSAILERAEASLGANWHRARPVLRVYDISCDEDSSPTKRCIASISIQAPVDHWYVPIADPRRAYELQLGYETQNGHYFMLARSASVKLPMPGTPQARKYDEQRHEAAASKIPDPAPRYPIRSTAFRFCDDVSLEVNADLLIAGRVSSAALLSCLDDAVTVRGDGTFEVRLALEEGRQVIPLEAVSPDGCQSRTVILAIERNTKTLEPQALSEWDD